MTTFQFLAVEEHLSSPELGEYISYAIRAWTPTPDGCAEAAYISDVSCDAAFAAALAERCTRLQLDPVHLLDVILDAIS